MSFLEFHLPHFPETPLSNWIEDLERVLGDGFVFFELLWNLGFLPDFEFFGVPLLVFGVVDHEKLRDLLPPGCEGVGPL